MKMNMKSNKLNYLMKMMIYHLKHLLINSKIVEMDDCYIMCKTPKSPLTYNEKREFMTVLILYDNTKEKKSKTTHFCVLTEAEKSKLVTYKANENAVYYVEIVGLKGLKCEKELKSIKKYLNEP